MSLSARLDKAEKVVGVEAQGMTREQDDMLRAFRRYRFGGLGLTSQQAIEQAGASLGLTSGDAKAIMAEPAVSAAQAEFWREVLAMTNKSRRHIHEKWPRQ